MYWAVWRCSLYLTLTTNSWRNLAIDKMTSLKKSYPRIHRWLWWYSPHTRGLFYYHRVCQMEPHVRPPGWRLIHHRYIRTNLWIDSGIKIVLLTNVTVQYLHFHIHSAVPLSPILFFVSSALTNNYNNCAFHFNITFVIWPFFTKGAVGIHISGFKYFIFNSEHILSVMDCWLEHSSEVQHKRIW